MNIKNVMMMAAMMPAFALAETNSNCTPASVEANDTTIRVNDQNIVIKQDGEQTSVKIWRQFSCARFFHRIRSLSRDIIFLH